MHEYSTEVEHNVHKSERKDEFLILWEGLICTTINPALAGGGCYENHGLPRGQTSPSLNLT